MAAQTKQSTGQDSGAANGLLSELPVDRLKEEMIGLGKALAKRGVSKLGESLTGATDKLGDLGDAVPGPGDMVKAAAVAPVKGAASKVKDAIPGMGSDDSDGQSGGKAPAGDDTNLKVTNIVESIDVPVSRDVAYQLWTQFEEFPSFMKKVENVNQKDPEVVTWKAQIFWSHRTWTAKIVDQVPPERIVWKSEADKGKVDGAVTFHELAPDLTRVLVSLEYHPQGLFERTGNLWRAQGRRVRLELKHFRRHVANHALLNQEDVDGWEGEIHGGKVQRRRGKKSASSGSSAKKSSSNGSSAKKSSSSGSPAKKSSSAGSPSSRSSSGGSPTKKSSSSGSSAKKSSSSSSPASRSSSGSSAAKKSASSGSTAKKSSPSGSATKKSAASGPTAKKSSSASSPAKKSASSGSTAKKSSSSGSSASKSPAKKSASKRTAAAAKRTPTTTSRASSGSGARGKGSSSARKSAGSGTRKSAQSGSRSKA